MALIGREGSLVVVVHGYIYISTNDRGTLRALGEPSPSSHLEHDGLRRDLGLVEDVGPAVGEVPVV